jgi:glycine/D-amino acid oxidase-like deaminating enzyme
MLKQRNHSSPYLGQDLTWLWRRALNNRGAPQLEGVSVPCFETQEKSIDSRLFAPELVKRVKQLPQVDLFCQHRVQAVQRNGDGFELQVMTAQGEKTIHADAVINCAWSDRIRLDETVGMKNTPKNLSYRVKHRVIVQPIHNQHDLCPVTMVQGPYGDVLPYADGTVYLSWYPLCRTHFDTMPPNSMVSNPQLLADVSRQTVQAMGAMFPALQNARVLSASPCVIVAPGQQDVDDPLSQLHQRNQSGPKHAAGWWSVDTGKLTLAPLHAKQMLEQLREFAGLE